MTKLASLEALLTGLPGAVVAYSGGVDSTLLAVTAHRTLGPRALAVTAVSATYPQHQLEAARALAAAYGFAHETIATDEFDDPGFLANAPDRCYHCKSALFRVLRGIADARGFGAILDGANLDDLDDHRPGHRAAKEAGVLSPLQAVGLTKAEIRELSRELGLPTWNKPAYACLASRVPYGRPITEAVLSRIEKAEAFLASLGLREFRVRDHHPIARVEAGQAELEDAWRHRAVIAERLHQLGFAYVALDLDGFRSGSMNEVLPAREISSKGVRR